MFQLPRQRKQLLVEPDEGEGDALIRSTKSGRMKRQHTVDARSVPTYPKYRVEPLGHSLGVRTAHHHLQHIPEKPEPRPVPYAYYELLTRTLEY